MLELGVWRGDDERGKRGAEGEKQKGSCQVLSVSALNLKFITSFLSLIASGVNVMIVSRSVYLAAVLEIIKYYYNHAMKYPKC